MPSSNSLKAYFGLAVLLGGLAVGETADAKSGLPACPANQSVRYHNCWGTYTSPDGAKYVGAWKDGKRDGRGTYTSPDGLKYVGMWKDNKRDGHGTFTALGAKYVGQFKDGKFEGHGTFTGADGTKYVGASKNGKMHGSGTIFAANGSVLRMGIFEDGKFIRSTPASSSAPATSPKTSSGSAFRIANGQFVTNHHVVDGCTTLKIDGNSGGRVVASDPIRDLALVSIANDRGEVANIRTTRIQLNETVTAAGFPLDGVFTGIAITNGTISRLSGLRGDAGVVQISAPVQPGNSGGPLLDTTGNVIGVVSSRLNTLKAADVIGVAPQNVNFAINGAALRAFLDVKNVNYKEVSNERELTGVQIAARASAFTVLVKCRR
jgi:flavin-binding protein dodecin